jgi:hypothetical protein
MRDVDVIEVHTPMNPDSAASGPAASTAAKAVCSHVWGTPIST